MGTVPVNESQSHLTNLTASLQQILDSQITPLIHPIHQMSSNRFPHWLSSRWLEPGAERPLRPIVSPPLFSIIGSMCHLNMLTVSAFTALSGRLFILHKPID